MQKYKSNITSASGAAIRNVPVHVLNEAGNPAYLFLDRAGAVPASNPLTTGADGTFYFYAANGRYSLRTTVEGASITDSDVVLLMDPEEITVAGPIAEAIQRAEAAAQQAQETVEDSGIPDLVAAAQNAVVDAGNAVGQALDAKTQAEISAQAAEAAKGIAEGAVGAAGAALAAAQQAAVKYERALLKFPDLAAATAAAGALPDDQRVDVESLQKRYRVVGGELVFVANLDQLRMDIGSADQGAKLVIYKALPDAIARPQDDFHKDFVLGTEFGCDRTGTVMSTASIQKAFEYAAKGNHVHFPPGIYLFNETLHLPHDVRKGAMVTGAGIYSTLFLYNGSYVSLDLLHLLNTSVGIGDVGGGLTLRDIMVDSAMPLSGGHALYVENAAHCNYQQIAFGRAHRSKNLWNGVWFSDTDYQRLVGFDFNVQNELLIVSGEGVDGTRPQYDLFVADGKMAGGKVGVHIAGGFDNLGIDNVMCTFNDTNVLIDNAKVAKPNQNLMFGPRFICEWSKTGHGFQISDLQPSLDSSNISIYGHVQNNMNNGIHVGSYPGGRLQIFAPHVSSNGGSGIFCSDNSAKISISPATQIFKNKRYGIEAAFSGLRLPVGSNFFDNTLGAFNGNVNPRASMQGVVNTSIGSYSSAGTNAGGATSISTDLAMVTATAEGTGVRLPDLAIGAMVKVVHISGAFTLFLYPSTGTQIGGGVQNAGVSMPRFGSLTLVRATSSVWYIVDKYASQ